ncbi:MAG: PIN domain-containing protein [Patescibacteria group bacterium]
MDEKFGKKSEMVKLVLDTDVIVDLLRTGDGVLVEIESLLNEGRAEAYISAVTMLEIRAGENTWEQEKLLEDILENIEIVSIDKQLAEFLGRMKRKLKGAMTLADLMIGGTSQRLKAKLVTRNKKHFESIVGIKFY